MSAKSQAIDALKVLATEHADPKECAKRGHQWKMAVHQELYECVQCGTPGYYDFKNSLVTADKDVAEASLKFKVENAPPVMPAQGQGSLAAFDQRNNTRRPDKAPASFAK